MKQIEVNIIKLIIWLILPFAFFILFWWISASFYIYNILNISETYVVISAFLGLVFGVAITLFTYNYLQKNFYSFPYKYLAIIYFFLSAISFAFMMGIPILVILLGILSGIYTGRRIHFNETETENIFIRVSLFSSLVTGFWVIFISLFAREDGEAHHILEKYTGMSEEVVQGPIGFISIVVVTIVFIFIQYYLTNTACKKSYRLD